MASYLKPRRGAYSAISASTLQSGEIFFETPTIGGARGKIMMGNGSTRYANQTYFLDLDTSGITFTNPTASVSTSFTNGVSAYAASYGSGQSLPNIIRSMKQALINAQAMLAKLNNDLNAIYPVGSIYITRNKSVPSTLPGTWTEIDAGRFLKAVGSSGTVGNVNAVNTGSSSPGIPAHTHTFTTGGVGDHTHTWGSGGRGILVASNGLKVCNFTNTGSGTLGYVPDDYCGTGAAGAHSHTGTTDSTGSGSAHSHTPGAPASYGVHVFYRSA